MMHKLFKLRRAAISSLIGVGIGAVIVALVLLAGCGGALPAKEGALIIRVPTTDREFRAKTIEPSFDMVIDHFVVTGQGPETEDTIGPVTVTKPDTTASFTRLAAGPWDIFVSARNAADDEIGYGSNSVSVEPSQTADCSVTVAPLQGTGTVHLDIGWDPPTLVGVPGLTSEWAPVSDLLNRQDITAEWVINQDNAEITKVDNTGWYLITFVLTDDTANIWGFADAVRLVKDQTSNFIKTLTADDLNAIVGGIDLEIFEDMEDAIHMTFTGAVPQVFEGNNMTVTADYEGDNPDAQFWFVNGQEQTAFRNTNEITIGASLGLGVYRLDHVVADSLARKMGGKAYLFSVVFEPPYPVDPQNVTYTNGNLSFTGSDPQGYKIWASSTALAGASGYNPFQHSISDSEVIFLLDDYATDFVFTVAGDTAYCPAWSDTMNAPFVQGASAAFRIDSVSDPSKTVTFVYTP